MKRNLWAYRFIRALIIRKLLFEYLNQFLETQQIKDGENNIVATCEVDYEYDDTPPLINNITTIDGIVITGFSEPVKTGAAAGAVKIKHNGTELPGTITQSEDGRELQFTPAGSLPQDQLTVEVSNTVEDQAGNKIENGFTQNFIYSETTTSIYDSSAPEVDKIEKKSNDYIITFSERIDPSTTTNSIEVKKGDGSVSGSVTVVNERTFKFTPGEVLEANKEYTLWVYSTLKDLSGKSINEFFHAFVVLNEDFLVFEKPDANKHTTSRIGNTYLFHGRDYEPELGLYYYRNRYFLPRIGRFLQTDPMGYTDSMNLYQAFNMNPVNFVDPYGEAVMPGVDPQVAKSAYIQFIQSGDSPDTALRKLEKYRYIDSEPIYQLALVTSTHVEPGAEVMGTSAYLVFEFSPAGIFKDIVSLPFGKDLVSGEKMKWWQKGLIAVPFIAKATKLYKATKAAKLFDTMGDAEKLLDTGADLTRSTNALTKAEKLKQIRIEYLEEFKKMTKIGEEALSGNLSKVEVEKIAKLLNEWRLGWGKIQKMKMPLLSRLKIYYWNIAPKWFPKVRLKGVWVNPKGYDTIYGPTLNWFLKQCFTHEDIIKKALKPSDEISKIVGAL